MVTATFIFALFVDVYSGRKTISCASDCSSNFLTIHEDRYHKKPCKGRNVEGIYLLGGGGGEGGLKLECTLLYVKRTEHIALNIAEEIDNQE